MVKEEHNLSKDKKNPCDGCTKCCEYVVLEIDTPEDKTDFGQIRWFLAHQDVSVYIDHDDSWNLQFETPCEKMSEEGWCEIYEKRPLICKTYSSENCDKNGEGHSFKEFWATLEDFDDWMKENKSKFIS